MTKITKDKIDKMMTYDEWLLEFKKTLVKINKGIYSNRKFKVVDNIYLVHEGSNSGVDLRRDYMKYTMNFLKGKEEQE